jgi:RNA polymerase sigma-70 factor (ECF subfamily)
MSRHSRDQTAEDRFEEVFAHLGSVTAYARRRGAADADAVAGEVMTIAWRRLADVPRDDARPWLYATARNIVHAEFRRRVTTTGDTEMWSVPAAATLSSELDPAIAAALGALSFLDREALLLVAWEDLTPTQAARALGIKPTAFRVRLLRARRRVCAALEELASDPCRTEVRAEMETT